MTSDGCLSSRAELISRIGLTAIAVVVLALAVAACGGDEDGDGSQAEGVAESTEPQEFTPLVASTLGVETAPVRGTDGRYHVVYELQLTNTKAVPARIRRIEVLDEADPDQVLETIAGPDLPASLRTLATAPVRDATIEPDGSRLLFVELAFDSVEQAPETLVHRLHLLGPKNPGATKATPLEYTITPFAMGDKAPATVGPPLKGGGWVAVNGCCAQGFVHRDSVQSVNGRLYDSQRFAIDYERLSDDGRFVEGDLSKPENWSQYGAEVLAAEDGTVVSTADDLPDQIPGSLPDAGSFDSLEQVDGNHIVIKFGDGVYGFYAHLQKGSVLVEPGDDVKRGEKLGLLGNSGNTSAPHLHFHLMTGPDVLASDGIPYVIDSFGYEGQVSPTEFLESKELKDDFGGERLAEPEPREDELPLNLSIVNFPGE